MRRVVITGLGIKSSIGNSKAEVVRSLREGRSGIRHSAEYAELGFRSHVHGPIELDLAALIDKKQLRFMGDAAAYCYLAMGDAIADAGLEAAEVSNPRTGLIAGSGGSSTENMILAADILRERGARKVPPTMVPRVMSSTCSACLAVPYRILGVNYSISSACATSAHCIGNAFELIRAGNQDVIFAGGGDELHWSGSLLFDAMGALSSRYNETPGEASRPFDAARDGFVISGGGGILVLEELEHARARGARIYAELVGYGATSDGYDMVKPSGEGARRCMEIALGGAGFDVDYINAHATSTPAGDIGELTAVRELFGKGNSPRISSTKSLTGHGLGAAGVNEAIFTLLMMEGDFLCASANITTLDPGAEGMSIVRELVEGADIRLAMSNSFGFGGTNATLVFRRLD